jgi:Lar family restriction alleviation protein
MSESLPSKERVDAELLRCPFCGGNGEYHCPAFVSAGESVVYWIVCSKCGSSCGAYSERASATKAWNHRQQGETKP